MKNKVLIVTTTPYMIRQFLMNDIKLLQNLGYEVEVATNCFGFNVLDEKSLDGFMDDLHEMKVKINQVDFTRSIFDFFNMLESYKQMRRVLSEGNYLLMHCHTPIASVVSRIAAKKIRTKNRLKVIYTAHGFHFFKGAPLKNWLMFYPIEKLLSIHTDVLITINKEDFTLGIEKMKCKNVVYLPGIGIDLKKNVTAKFDRVKFRELLGLDAEDFVILSVGELNKNKNHELVIRVIASLRDSRIHYLIAGQGDLKKYLLNLAKKLGVKDQVHLLGFRKDIRELNFASDLFILPSLREGLNVSLMEAMSCGLPCIANKIRGNVDLIDNEKGGYLLEKNNAIELSNCIKKIKNSNNIEMRIHNQNKITLFSKETVMEELENVYREVLKK